MTCKLLAATAALLIPLAGVAQDPPATPSGQGGTFDALDANQDGRISMPEATADPALVEVFATADKNGDGYLDRTEFSSRPKVERSRPNRDY